MPGLEPPSREGISLLASAVTRQVNGLDEKQWSERSSGDGVKVLRVIGSAQDGHSQKALQWRLHPRGQESAGFVAKPADRDTATWVLVFGRRARAQCLRSTWAMPAAREIIWESLLVIEGSAAQASRKYGDDHGRNGPAPTC